MTPPTSPTAAATAPDDARFYRGVLHELIGMGADIARSVHRRIMAADAKPGADDGPDLTVVFDRVARAVRRTVLLARSLDEAAAVAAAGWERRAAGRRRVLREVEDTIKRRAPAETAEGLEAELHERVERPEFGGELDNRPVAEIIADICRDLGLVGVPGSQPWKRRRPAEVAALCARAAEVVCAPPGMEWATAEAAGPAVGAMVTPQRARFRGG